jgi:hypothetical protein
MRNADSASRGFTSGNQMNVYGEKYEMAGEPVVITYDLVLVEAIGWRSQQLRRVRIPLPILRIATRACRVTVCDERDRVILRR